MSAVSIAGASAPGLAERWRAFRAGQPRVRVRDAARELGVSEAELLATGVDQAVTRLRAEPAAIMRRLPALGECLALTRNEHAVSEVRGRYDGVELGPAGGLVLGREIDLRVFLHAWRFTFAVEEPLEDGPRRSLHFFDGQGTAVHKVYLEPRGDLDAWRQLRDDFATPERGPLRLDLARLTAPERPDGDVDVRALRRRWDGLRDTHELVLLLRELGLRRLQALRLAGAGRATEVGPGALARVLTGAAVVARPIMIFVPNLGTIQIRSGPVVRVERLGPWLNVLDPGFNLHVREDRVATAWVVRKPTASGTITSLEVFDAFGETVLLAFARRDDRAGEAEPAWWRELLAAQERGP